MFRATLLSNGAAAGGRLQGEGGSFWGGVGARATELFLSPHVASGWFGAVFELEGGVQSQKRRAEFTQIAVHRPPPC